MSGVTHWVGNSRAFVWSPIDHDVYPVNGPNRIDGPNPRSLSEIMVSDPTTWNQQFVAPGLSAQAIYASPGDVEVLRIVAQNPGAVVESIAALHPPPEVVCTAYGEFAFAEGEHGVWHCCAICGALLEETTQQAHEEAMADMAADLAFEAWKDDRWERESDA